MKQPATHIAATKSRQSACSQTGLARYLSHEFWWPEPLYICKGCHLCDIKVNAPVRGVTDEMSFVSCSPLIEAARAKGNCLVIMLIAVWKDYCGVSDAPCQGFGQDCRAGNSIAARIAMMAITTSNSIKVKAPTRRAGRLCSIFGVAVNDVLLYSVCSACKSESCQQES